jgi:hypothetical protein
LLDHRSIYLIWINAALLGTRPAYLEQYICHFRRHRHVDGASITGTSCQPAIARVLTYRFDLLGADGKVFATHEIDYPNDEAAIVGGHLINGDPPIGRGFQIWRDGVLIYFYDNPDSGPEASGVLKKH